MMAKIQIYTKWLKTKDLITIRKADGTNSRQLKTWWNQWSRSGSKAFVSCKNLVKSFRMFFLLRLSVRFALHDNYKKLWLIHPCSCSTIHQSSISIILITAQLTVLRSCCLHVHVVQGLKLMCWLQNIWQHVFTEQMRQYKDFFQINYKVIAFVWLGQRRLWISAVGYLATDMKTTKATCCSVDLSLL